MSPDSWSQLKACGPLPGRPAKSGEFMMEVSAYSDRSMWWIKAEPG